jgi:hypothetical protein
MKTFYFAKTSDPLAKFLMSRLNFSPTKAVVFIITVAFIYDILQFFLFGNIPGSYLEVITILAWHYVFIPAMGFFYLWSNSALPSLLNKLAKLNTIQLSNAEIDINLQLLDKPWRFLISVVGGLIIGLLYLARSAFFEGVSTNPVLLVPRQVSWFIAGYMVTMLSSTLIMNVLIISNVFRNQKIHLEPMHPDKSAGLGELGRYSKVIAYLISTAGLVIGITELRYFYSAFPEELWIIHTVIPIYIIGATISFFAPILFVHWKMKETKKQLLIEIQEKIAHEYYASKEKIIQNSESIEDNISKIKQLQTLYELTEKIPEWPFNLQALNGYLFSIFSPLLSIGLGVIGDQIKEFLFP